MFHVYCLILFLASTTLHGHYGSCRDVCSSRMKSSAQIITVGHRIPFTASPTPYGAATSHVVPLSMSVELEDILIF